MNLKSLIFYIGLGICTNCALSKDYVKSKESPTLREAVCASLESSIEQDTIRLVNEKPYSDEYVMNLFNIYAACRALEENECKQAKYSNPICKTNDMDIILSYFRRQNKTSFT